MPTSISGNRITGRPVNPGRNAAGLFDRGNRPPRVAPEFLRRQRIHQLVGVAVAADLVSRSHNFPDRARISLRHPTQYKKSGFRAPCIQKFQDLLELIFNPGRKCGPLTLVYSRLDLCRVKVFLDVNGHGIEHAASKPYARRCLRKKTAMEYSIETNPSTAVSALRSNIRPSRETP